MPTTTGQMPQKQVVFFTDRSLYRPGQTIYYKGIAILVDQEDDNYKVLPNEPVNVVFTDANGKEIARQTLRTNDYGSFSGSFTAPRDRLMGRMMIRTRAACQGNTWVNVEEYKRPKFQVTLDAPKTAARLGGEVQLKARRSAYTGRGGGRGEGPLPRRPPGPLSRLVVLVFRLADAAIRRQEIAHGTAETEADGTFKIQFIAKPDLSGRGEGRADLPVRGLGRRDRHQRRDPLRRSGTVQAGYTALRASLVAPASG